MTRARFQPDELLALWERAFSADLAGGRHGFARLACEMSWALGKFSDRDARATEIVRASESRARSSTTSTAPAPTTATSTSPTP